ncbi:predicted protein [Ostreococcus lucimarinus CCE9901]|uniref:Uncharacterized protein n=1 Tax=Ostreococcus lucimarinus (strain CCE9901) TaxID=436017 RepID=A4SAA7_OSTLU|nr:predicted protein [Ostreococcus lucimarinus CCE9901]ABP00668.1 predicted protein [Ostreococcus lucimarinus CCE9901]|eukprot:XP_001422351.1 predicted protein [Ostreococcus lucimarinus CCE9901]
MLENGVLAENALLHNFLPDLNFGFTCSNFEHPTSTNMEISVDSADDQDVRAWFARWFYSPL